jgi:drug/metabolite transporter (DMT)-like permease
MRWLLLATMATWGINLPVMTILLPVFGPQATPVLRMLCASALLSLVTWRVQRGWPRLSRQQWLVLVMCGAVMVYANQVFLMQGLRRTTATNAALIMALNPLLSSLMAAVAFRLPITAARWWGLALGFGGVAAVVLHRPEAALGGGGLGDLLVLGSVITWVAGGVMVQRLGDPRTDGIDTGTLSWAVNMAGTAMLVLHFAFLGEPLLQPGATPSWSVAALLVMSGFLATAVGSLVWNRALATLGVSHVSLYVYWVPIFGVAFSVLLLGEPLTVWHLAGLAAVLGGTWLGTRGGPRAIAGIAAEKPG